MKLRLASMTDGYKLSHAIMYHDSTEMVYSNITPRHNKYYVKDATRFYDNKVVVMGLQAAVVEIYQLFNEFFEASKEEVIAEFQDRLSRYTGVDVHDMVGRFSDLHDFGKIPLNIAALPDGSKVDCGIPIITIHNTNQEFFWVVNYFESLISDLVWKTCTNATIAHEFKTIANHYAEVTGTDDFTVSIQFHDFSMRGMSGPEDTARSGVAHLASFVGSDNIPSLDYVEDYYGKTENLAMGVPATEHAVATNNILTIAQNTGQDLIAAERDFLVDLITRKFPTGLVSYVADSFDYWSLVTETLPSIKDVIMSRTGDGVVPDKLVIRPDSGDPVKVVCGYRVLRDGLTRKKSLAIWMGSQGYDFNLARDYFDKYDAVEFEGLVYPVSRNRNGLIDFDVVIPEHEVKGTIECLWDTFGGTINEKGFKVLDSHIGLIYGDSITRKRAVEIFERLAHKGFASGNVVLGIGSYTYQSSTRDTLGFAMKATYSRVNGKCVEIYKDPKTDSKKKSARGLLVVSKDDNGDYVLTDQVKIEDFIVGEFEILMMFGELLYRNFQTFQEVRNRLNEK